MHGLQREREQGGFNVDGLKGIPGLVTWELLPCRLPHSLSFQVADTNAWLDLSPLSSKLRDDHPNWFMKREDGSTAWMSASASFVF
jgi:hypothetical protein